MLIDNDYLIMLTDYLISRERNAPKIILYHLNFIFTSSHLLQKSLHDF